MANALGPVPLLEISGLDTEFTDEERALLAKVRAFAADEMRPTGARLDAMTAEAVMAADSPLWNYLKKFKQLGIGRAEMAKLGTERLKRMSPMMFEEFGWGDWGLAVAAFTSTLAGAVLQSAGKPALAEKYASYLGCWVAMQQDRGSDMIDYQCFELSAGFTQSHGSLRAVVREDEILLHGQSSDWIACAPFAECALVHCPADYGNGFSRPDGGVFGAGLFVPFDLPGVVKSAPNEKIGQRSVPTGRVTFNNVRVPASHLLYGKDEYYPSILRILASCANNVAAIATGAARAAFEHAFHYARTRAQGGVPLSQHQHMRWRLFEMWRKIEVSRAIIRRASAYNLTTATPQALASATAKITATQMAMEIVTEAIQIFGGNGVGKAFPIEKLVRDVTAGMMEGGENHVLALQGGNWLLQAYAAMGDAAETAAQ